ncbi:glutathione peroxidase [Pontibacter pamirensis]|uniref:glutathione peroxidase n=1 Tax=Pontibacter pamirensis TaxID=2562824 RepID=UPI001389AA87|nr:glutathione peroxidase [Pontibacter pamirensis]
MTRTFTFMLQAAALMGLLAVFVACQNSASQNLTSDSETMATETTSNPNAQTSDFYGFQMKTLDGRNVNFSDYKGKKVLLVNTASECGYTPQYAELQQLHEAHGNEVVVLGFPANNFGGQEPGSNEEIASFCQKNYGVTFPMFEKVSVVGEDKHPLFTWLQQNAPNKEEPSWNFSKYLIDENGSVVAFYPSKVKPMDKKLLAAIRQ